jgi:hypothetical protein
LLAANDLTWKVLAAYQCFERLEHGIGMWNDTVL